MRKSAWDIGHTHIQKWAVMMGKKNNKKVNSTWNLQIQRYHFLGPIYT